MRLPCGAEQPEINDIAEKRKTIWTSREKVDIPQYRKGYSDQDTFKIGFSSGYPEKLPPDLLGGW